MKIGHNHQLKALKKECQRKHLLGYFTNGGGGGGGGWFTKNTSVPEVFTVPRKSWGSVGNFQKLWTHGKTQKIEGLKL